MVPITELKTLLRRTICIEIGKFYYRDPEDRIAVTNIGDRTQYLTYDGITHAMLTDQIVDKRILNLVKIYGRSMRRYFGKNLAECADLAKLHLGKPVDFLYLDYEKWLQTCKARSDGMHRRRYEESTTPSETDPDNPPENMNRSNRIKYLSAVTKETFDGYVRYLSGITRSNKTSFEVQYTLDNTKFSTYALKKNYAYDHAKELADFAFKIIKNEPAWRKRLRADARYRPTDIHVTRYGDIYIEFTIIDPKKET